MSNTSILNKIKELQDSLNDDTTNSHILIAVELDEDGMPQGSAVKIKGKPFEVLGMIDFLDRKIVESRDEIHQKLDKLEAMSKMANVMDEMPTELRAKLEELKERAEKCMENNDLMGALEIREQLKRMMRDHAESNEKKSDEEGFNINDFK